MGFGGFLKKLGTDVAKGLTIAAKVEGFLPLATPFLPAGAQSIEQTVVRDFDAIKGVISTVESGAAALTTPGLTGAQKAAMAQPAIAQLVIEWLQSGVLGSKKIKDPALFQQGTAEINDGFVKVLSSIEG